MTAAELLMLDFDGMVANTRRVLERVPATSGDWTPHEKSMPLGRLAMHCATLPRFAKVMLAQDTFDMSTPGERPELSFHSAEAAQQRLSETSGEARSLLAGSSDAQLQADWLFTFGDRVIFQGPRALAYRTIFADHLIHHTGQLTVYLRLLGVPVPGLFGPSADEP